MHLIHKLSVKSISHVRVERGTNAGLIVTLYKQNLLYFLATSSLYSLEKTNVPKLKKSFEDIAKFVISVFSVYLKLDICL